MRAAGDAGDSVRPELRRRRGARPADRGDARGGRRRIAARTGARARLGTFRPYHSTDVRGVEIGGAAKNVLAIAAGIVTGRGLGASAAAALTTRGFAELVRFGRAFGARPETLTGLSGPRRSDPDLLEPAVAQFLLRRRARPGRDAGRRRARQAGRRRLHRAGAAGDGARERRRHADLGRGRRGAGGQR